MIMICYGTGSLSNLLRCILLVFSKIKFYLNTPVDSSLQIFFVSWIEVRLFLVHKCGSL